METALKINILAFYGLKYWPRNCLVDCTNRLWGSEMKIFILILVVIVSINSKAFFVYEDRRGVSCENDCPGKFYNLATWEELGVVAQKGREIESAVNSNNSRYEEKFQQIQSSISDTKQNVRKDLEIILSNKISASMDDIFGNGGKSNKNREKLVELIQQIVTEEIQRNK